MKLDTHPETGTEIRDNLFLDPFVTVINYYGDTQALEFWEEKLVVSIRDSDETTGFFHHSDIIIQYDEIDRMPKVVAERVYRNRYPYLKYLLWKRQWENKVKSCVYTRVPGSEIAWKMRLSDCKTYFDIIYFDEEWFEWQKRIANKAASFAVAVAVLLQPLTCLAYSAEELYGDCGVEYESPYDEDDLNTISNYNYAKRYASMFRYVAGSEFDERVLQDRIEKCEKELEEVEEALLSGYDKSVDEIYQLESDYNRALTQLEEAKSTTLPVDIDVKRMTADEIPTYNEYVKALNRKRAVDHSLNLGDEKAPSISMNAELIKDYTSDSITYATVEGSGITSMYNGRVAAVGENHVTINHHNGIASSYLGVKPTVKVGDTVIQGGPIGITSGEFSVKLKVGGKLVDVYKLLEVSDENLQD